MVMVGAQAAAFGLGAVLTLDRSMVGITREDGLRDSVDLRSVGSRSGFSGDTIYLTPPISRTEPSGMVSGTDDAPMLLADDDRLIPPMGE